MNKKNLSKSNLEKLRQFFYYYLETILNVKVFNNDEYLYIYDEYFDNILDLTIIDYNKNIKYLNTITLERSERHKTELYIQIVFRKRMEKSHSFLEILKYESYLLKRTRKDKIKKISL